MKFQRAGIQQVRDTIGPLADAARYAAGFTIITRRGKPAAALVSTEWARLPDAMAAELAPMAECSRHPLSGEDPAACRDCSIRRVYLDYLAAGGTDTRPAAIPASGFLRLPQRNHDGSPYHGEPERS